MLAQNRSPRKFANSPVNEMPKPILLPGDLPKFWQDRWRGLAQMFIASREYTRAQAEHEAFLMARDAYWRSVREAIEGDDAPSFDAKGGEDAIAGDA